MKSLYLILILILSFPLKANLIVSDTENTQKLLNELSDSLESFLEAYEEEEIIIKIEDAKGNDHKFTIKNFVFSIKARIPTSNNAAGFLREIKLFQIKELSCKDNNYSGLGVNNTSPYIAFSNFKLPQIDYFTLASKCEIKGLNINLDLIIDLLGTDTSAMAIEQRILLSLIERALSDIEIRLESKYQRNNLLGEFYINLGEEIKLKSTITQSFDHFALYEFLETVRLSILDITGLSEKEVIDNLYLVADYLMNDEYFIQETTNRYEEYNYSSPQILYNLTYEVSWSDKVFKDLSVISGGLIDGALLLIKTFTGSSKMNKSDFSDYLIYEIGLDGEYQALYMDALYNFYSDTFSEAKKFANDPKGLGIKIKAKDGLDLNSLERAVENPTVIFTILNNIELQINSNPGIR